jgi:peroxiredoxin
MKGREMNDSESREFSETAQGRDESWSVREVLLAVAAFVIIIALSVGGYFIYQETRPPAVVEGSQAPEFTFPLLDGGEASLSDYKGEVVLLNMWATTCIECLKEMPLMEEKYRELKGQPFEILAVSTDPEGAEVVQPFLENIGENEFDDPGALSFPVLLDTENTVADMYQTRKYPESFIIDKEGKVVGIIIGKLQDSDFFLIEELIAE